MNSKLFFILILVVAAVAVFGLTSKPKQESSMVASANIQDTAEPKLLTLQSKTMGVVSVEVTPTSVEMGKELVFDLTMNNHSIDLDYDYTQIASLTDDQGNTYQPTKWTGNSEGHHVSGQLIFPILSDKVKQLTLTLKGVDNETEDFNWQL